MVRRKERMLKTEAQDEIGDITYMEVNKNVKKCSEKRRK
jgi:hypothetical protein